MPAEAVRPSIQRSLLLDGQEVECRLVRSKAAKKLRIKVMYDGVEVIVPEGRDTEEGLTFVSDNRAWVIKQLERARQLRSVRRPDRQNHGQILFRGELVSVNVVRSDRWHAPNRVMLQNGVLSVTCGTKTKTAVPRSIEYWLRKKVRENIMLHIGNIGKRVKRSPNRIYIMGQRTKWGNCSALSNLSFNWRLIMAPDYVLRYMVTHEMAHLVIPDHSPKFWLMVKSICVDTERARQWLSSNGKNIIDTNVAR